MWIYEHSTWPDFSWDAEALEALLAEVRHQQGKLLGRMEGLGFDLRQQASLDMLTKDVVKTSAIEGERLNPEEVRSSLAQRLGIHIAGLPPAGRDVEGIVSVMLDATQDPLKPLTKERVCDWQAALFPTGRSGLHKITVGNLRPISAGKMQVISGRIGHEKIHFEAPDANTLSKEMKVFLAWFNAKQANLDPVLKAGIAHFWFVTIHPFEDGNGRIARAIGDMSLARADGQPERFYSLSTQIESEKKAYYATLEKQQKSSPDLTLWLSWFLACLKRAIDSAESSLEKVLYKAHLWQKLNEHAINERQRLIINRMLADDFEGFMNTSKYARMAKCSKDTALRDITILLKLSVLTKNPGSGRSTSYALASPN